MLTSCKTGCFPGFVVLGRDHGLYRTLEGNKRTLQHMREQEMSAVQLIWWVMHSIQMTVNLHREIVFGDSASVSLVSTTCRWWRLSLNSNMNACFYLCWEESVHSYTFLWSGNLWNLSFLWKLKNKIYFYTSYETLWLHYLKIKKKNNTFHDVASDK